ncbi:MAG: hypothetical protein ACI9DJ_003033 [Algoriphagus sp.]|jgi:hypothetical protein
MRFIKQQKETEKVLKEAFVAAFNKIAIFSGSIVWPLAKANSSE